jgi:serine/threonine protein kinase
MLLVADDPALLDEEERKSLLQEASILASLDHYHVVHVFGIPENEDTGRLGLVMRNMPHSLGNAAVLRDLGLQTRLSYVLQIAKGLGYLHGRPQPVVHGDIKPGNVLVSKGNVEVALSDFGFSRVKQSQSTSIYDAWWWCICVWRTTTYWDRCIFVHLSSLS